MKKTKIGKYRCIAIILAVLPAAFLLKNTAGHSVSDFIRGGVKNYVMIAFLPAAFWLFLKGNDLEEKEKQKNRTEQIKKAYPEFALKVAMLIRAGFTP